MFEFLTSLLIISLPINLAKTFIVDFGYVQGSLVDYLLPKIYFVQIIQAIFVIYVLYKFSIYLIVVQSKNKALKWFILIYLIFTLLSGLVAKNIGSFIYSYITLLLNVCFAFCIGFVFYKYQKFYELFGLLISYVVIFISVVGIYQFIFQESLFNNYLLFGEIPFTFSTYMISKENFFGFTKIPAYSIFSHPNVFGAFLSISLIWVFYFKKKIAFVFGIIGLLLTFSFLSYFVTFFGIISLIFIKKFGKTSVIASLIFILIFTFSSFFVPIYSKVLNYTTLIVRGNLQNASLEIISNAFFTGVGLNNSLMYMNSYLRIPNIVRFIQPVHNIYLLILSEIGIFGLLGFLGICFSLFITLLRQSYGVPAVLFVSLSQLLLLGSYDHYIVTIIQTQLLFWLTVGFIITYTYKND